MPPTIRFTDLGIRQVPEDLIEAANAFGSTASQKLFKVQLPLATGTIMVGVNQSIMLSLSMVVTASLVGAPGLGVDVYRSVTQVNIGMGFEVWISYRSNRNYIRPYYTRVPYEKIMTKNTLL